MPLSLKPARLKRYKDILLLLVRHGRADLLDGADLDRSLLDEIRLAENKGRTGEPEDLARDLEALGPTFVKLGQALSARPDLLPAPYLIALARLQDDVEPFAHEQVRKVIEDELGARLTNVFREFDETPAGSGSLAQVHLALLRDGRPVAVKVQRPGIRGTVIGDLDALDDLAGAVDSYTDLGRRHHFREIVHEFRKALLSELDFRQEARNLIHLAEHLARYRKYIVIPRPIEGLAAPRVLVMERIRGTKVTELGPLATLEFDGEELVSALLKAYLDQVLVDGFFHADPHPGNVLLTEDRKLGIVDLGMVAHVHPSMRRELCKIVLALTDDRGDEVARDVLGLSTVDDEADRRGFDRAVADLVARHQRASVQEIGMGRLLLEVVRTSGEHGVHPPPELALLGKTLLQLNQVASALAPHVQPAEVVRSHAQSILMRQFLHSLSPSRVFSSLLEVNEFAQELPRRLNAVFDRLSRGRLDIKVDVLDEEELATNMQKVANRITMGLVLAALIIGAALLMRVETSFTLLGYPGLAMILFLFAALGGIALVGSIFWGDRRK